MNQTHDKSSQLQMTQKKKSEQVKHYNTLVYYCLNKSYDDILGTHWLTLSFMLNSISKCDWPRKINAK